jgi:phthalate 4,5-dioxygenase oxygenase subunit
VLGRNECNGLRCIFHGWKFDVEGKTVEITTEPDAERAADFASKVRLKHYPTREAGGLVWVWLGAAKEPPFPSLPFVGEHEQNNWLSVSRAQCNWLQGVEGTLDSVHVGTLHNTYISTYVQRTAGAGTSKLSLNSAPRYEVDASDYGLRAAALRTMADGRTYLRLTEHFIPFVSLVPADKQGNGVIFIATPVDDTHHLLFFGYWSEHGPRQPEDTNVFMTRDPVYDPHNFVNLKGGPDENWGQDRTLMAAGHFTGFGENIVAEDMVVQLSMGPIADRTDEMLSTSDVAIVRLRRFLLDAVKADSQGKLPPGSALGPDPVRMR